MSFFFLNEMNKYFKLCVFRFKGFFFKLKRQKKKHLYFYYHHDSMKKIEKKYPREIMEKLKFKKKTYMLREGI